MGQHDNDDEKHDTSDEELSEKPDEKKQKSSENVEDPQPSTSSDKNKDKKKEKSPKVKKSVKIKEPVKTNPQYQRRFSPSEYPSRYKIAPRQDRPQRSHSVRNIVPQSTPEPKKPVKPPRKRLEFDEPTTADRDHHEAVDFYNRSTPYSYTRESLVNLRKPLKNEPRSNLHHHRQTPAHQRLHFHLRRCNKCLHAKNECVCGNVSSKPLKSDWAVLVQPQIETPRTWVRPRTDWLSELEDKSTIDYEKLVDEKFNASREIFCCPFNTFRIFSKRDIKTVKYYVNN